MVVISFCWCVIIIIIFLGECELVDEYDNEDKRLREIMEISIRGMNMKMKVTIWTLSMIRHYYFELLLAFKN